MKTLKSENNEAHADEKAGEEKSSEAVSDQSGFFTPNEKIKDRFYRCKDRAAVCGSGRFRYLQQVRFPRRKGQGMLGCSEE